MADFGACVRCTNSAILVTALFIRGVLFRPSYEVLNWVLLGASVPPLLHAVTP